MTTTSSTRQSRIEHVLLEVTSLLAARTRVQLERDTADPTAADDLRRLQALEKELAEVRRELGIEAAAAHTPGRQVSRFYEVPGQEDA